MPADQPLHAIEEAAATWLVERDRGLTPERGREFERWLCADARHAAAFEALAATWTLMGEAGSPASRPSARPAKKIHWLAPALATAAAIAVGYLGWVRVERGAAPPADHVLTAATEVGMLRKLELPDGSVIQLNTDSAVDVRYEGDVRRVRLTRGEAHFTVAKNNARPFIVTAGGVDVRVVGTVFNVRLRSESVDVLVTEGKVRVGSPETDSPAPVSAVERSGARSELTAGQKLSVTLGTTPKPAAPAPIAVTTTEIRQALAWQARRLDFDATPLSDIVAEINRYNRHQLVVADPQLNAQRFGGSFPANDHQTFVRMLAADFGVVAEEKGGMTLLRLKAK